MTERKQNIINTVKDLVGDFLYYGRKEDEDLPRGAIDNSVRIKEISIDEIVSIFREELEKGLS